MLCGVRDTKPGYLQNEVDARVAFVTGGGFNSSSTDCIYLAKRMKERKGKEKK